MGVGHKWFLQGSDPINNFWDDSIMPGLEAAVLVFERKVAVVVMWLGRAMSRGITLDSSNVCRLQVDTHLVIK